MDWDYPEAPDLSETDQRVLRETTISLEGPGTILHDFEALLAYVAAHEPELTADFLLAPADLRAANARLSEPVAHVPAQPQPQDLPAITGLYLLLLSSTLAHVDLTGSKPTLRLREPAYRSWQALNPTERYGTLLEAWFVRGTPELIGERPLILGDPADCFGQAYRAMVRLPDEGKAVAGDPYLEMLFHLTGTHTLALLALFGWVELRAAEPEAGAGWQPAWAAPTPLGTALLNLLNQALFANADDTYDVISQIMPDFGVLQPVLEPYFPEWQEYPQQAEPPLPTGVLTFDVYLADARRRLAVPAAATMEDLAYAILDAVKFEVRDYLYRFTFRNRRGLLIDVNHPEMDDGPWADQVVVGNLPLRAGEPMLFILGYSDSWEFVVKLLAVDETAQLDEPELLGGEGEPPQQLVWYDDSLAWDDEEWDDDAWDDADAPFDP